MKIIIAFLILMAGLSVKGMAQSQNNPNNNSSATCGEQAVQDLCNCFEQKNVTYSLVPSMSGNVLYLYIMGNPPRGRVVSCMQQYDAEGNTCSDLPVIIESSVFE